MRQLKNVVAIHTNDTSYLVKQTDYNAKINEIENKINNHNHVKYITTQEFNQKLLV